VGPSKSWKNKYARRKGEAGLHKHSLRMPKAECCLAGGDREAA